MIAFALLSLPVFGVLVLGWIAVRSRLADAKTIEVLASFSFRFALPALVLRLIASQPLERSFNPGFFCGYLASGALVFLVVFGARLIAMPRGTAEAGACAAAASVSNLGFLGPPLMLAYLGERGAGPLAMAILAEVMLLLSLGGAIIGVARGNRSKALTIALRTTIRNPLVTAITLGTILAAARLVLPPPVGALLSFLGGSAGPTALFAIGGALGLRRVQRATALSATAIAGAKLVLYPAITWCVLTFVLKLEPFWIQSGVVLASLPSAGSTFVIARYYNADAERVSAAIAISTIVSIATVPSAAWSTLR